MAFHVFLFLLVFFLILSLALLWRLCGCGFSFPIHKQGADTLWSTVCSSPAHRLIAPSVVSPCKEAAMWDLPLRQYAPGAR